MFHMHRKNDNTSVHISLIFVWRDMFLLIQMIFSWDMACVACAILNRISGFESSSVTITPPGYLNWFTVSSLLSLILMSPQMSSALFAITFVYSTFISMPNVWLSYEMSLFIFSSLPPKTLISLANHTLDTNTDSTIMVI